MGRIRQRYAWRVRGQEIPLGARTYVAAALRVGADARPDLLQGDRIDSGAVLAEAQRLADLGVDLIELTAHTAWPHPKPVDSAEELRRLVPALRKIRPRIQLPLAVETYHAASAERVFGLGADVIHDPTALSADPKLAPVVNQQSAGLILGHLRGSPGSWDRSPAPLHLADVVASELDSASGRSRQAGLDARQVMLDPGLGMGKKGPENYRILDRLDILGGLHRPLMVALSRQHFLTENVRAGEAEWRWASAAAATLAIYRGAHMIRSDDPEALLAVAKAADRIHTAVELSP